MKPFKRLCVCILATDENSITDTHTVMFDPEKEAEYTRKTKKVEKYLIERGFSKLGSGASRYVFHRKDDDYVIKVPISRNCRCENFSEYKAWSRSHDPRYAPCKLFYMFDVPVIMMERVDPIFTPQQANSVKCSDEYIMKWVSKLPTWCFSIDHIQVGISLDETIRAFDYPSDVLKGSSERTKSLQRMNDKIYVFKRVKQLQKDGLLV